jgi:HD-like signal output (HDOD) protein
MTAIASQGICHELGDAKLNDEAFIAGLMHDTGKVLMFTHDPGLYESVLKFSFESNYSSVLAEHKYFGFDHCEVGLEAVKEWKLPDRFNDYMGVELSTLRSDQRDDVVLLSLLAANYLVKSAGVGANAVTDNETRKATLIGFGLDETLCDHLLQSEFIEGLMENETYKLCANI